MRTILFLVRKEFLQIFRHRIMLPLIFVMPIVQLLILANAADYEVKNILLHVVDRDLSTASYRLAGKFRASRYFELTDASVAVGSAWENLEAGRADLFLEIPPHFERNLLRDDFAQVQLTIDAINGMQAGIIQGYVNAILQDFNGEIRADWIGAPPAQGIQLTYAHWFNPELDYQHFMVPGILVILVTLVGMFLCGMNIVKEKEIGTIEQINVTPIKKYQFIVGKLLPFWIIALAELAIGLLVGVLVFDIPIVGSLGLVFGFAAVYLLVVLGLGLLVSTVTHSQQQSMFLSWFLLIIFILLSGLFTPIESMPAWTQKVVLFNPVAYFVEVMRMVLLKGSDGWNIRYHFSVMLVFALVINSLAIWNYRKQSA
jgi:ABC-2 type transport system permease protein